MGWMILGGILIVVWVWLWAILVVASDADDRSIREWERRRDDLRDDDR